MKLHEDVLVESSVAVQFTVVDPTGNVEPEGGEHAGEALGQLSETVGAG